jgi:hypothetical protein
MGPLKRALLLVEQLPAIEGLSLGARNARRRRRRSLYAKALWRRLHGLVIPDEVNLDRPGQW